MRHLYYLREWHAVLHLGLRTTAGFCRHAVSHREQNIKQYTEFDFMDVWRQAREAQASLASQGMAAACCGKSMYRENDRSFLHLFKFKWERCAQ